MKTEVKQKTALNIYFTAGYPRLEDFNIIMEGLIRNGADKIEVGIPFSDPIADGKVIQQSSAVALKNGATLDYIFNSLFAMKPFSVPVILMGYLNPVMQYGLEKFCKKAAESGVSGLIIPDMPTDYFENNFSPTLKKYKLEFTFLISPECSDQRIKYLDSLSSGFLYAVTSSSTTGQEKGGFDKTKKYLKRIKFLKLKNPVFAGFGISCKTDIDLLAPFVDGCIIGSSFIKSLDKDDLNGSIDEFFKKLR